MCFVSSFDVSDPELRDGSQSGNLTMKSLLWSCSKWKVSSYTKYAEKPEIIRHKGNYTTKERKKGTATLCSKRLTETWYDRDVSILSFVRKIIRHRGVAVNQQ